MMRILHIVPKLSTGGVETSTLRLACMQRSLGHTPIVMSAGGPLVSQLKAENIQHITASFDRKNPLYSAWNAFKLRKILSTLACDIVHVHSRAPAWAVYWALNGLDIPWVTTFHGAYGHRSGLKRLYNSAMLKGGGVIAPSHYIKDHIEAIYPDHPPLQVAYPGIDLDYFSNRHFTRAQIRQQRHDWGLKQGDIALLLPGRLSRIKGHLVAIEALQLLKNPCAKLIIIGEGQGSYVSELQNAVQSMPGQVFFFPAQQDLRLCYVASDIVLSTTTKAEAFGLTVLESQALGKPVIVTNLGGPKEIVQDRISGWIIPAQDPAALATAIVDLCRIPLKSNAQHLTKFDQKTCAAEILAFYQRVISA